MAYQNVGTPRFYINVMEWLANIGAIANIPSEHYRTLPVNSIHYDWSIDAYNPLYLYNVYGTLSDKSFIALLGHNLKTMGLRYSVPIHEFGPADQTPLVNAGNHPSGGQALEPEYDGFSISTFDGTGAPDALASSGGVFDVGSIIIGTYYDMPHSPDLSLTMSREYSHKTIETKGGSSLSNANWTKPPMWGNLGAWELGATSPGQQLARSGRRTWDLSFSYLDDGDVFGSNQFINQTTMGVHTVPPYDVGDIMTSGSSVGGFEYNLLDDPNFYSQVIHKTNGGQLPFIFQPNKDDNTNFAICKFDMNSFKFTQTAPGLYSCKLKIRECW